MARLASVNAARDRWRTWVIAPPPPGRGLTWRETFTGRIVRGDHDPNQTWLAGDPVTLELSLTIDDVKTYIEQVRARQGDPARPLTLPVPGAPAPAQTTDVHVTGGRLASPALGTQTVTRGVFRAFEAATDRPPVDRLALRMRYRLELIDSERRPAGELTGFKLIENDPGYDSWSDATTLFFRLTAADDGDPGWSGVLRISPRAFLAELLTFRGTPPGLRGSHAVLAYGRHFVGETLRAYSGPPAATSRPAFPCDVPVPAWGLLPAGKAAEAAAAVDFQPCPSGPLHRAIVHFAVPDLPFPLNLHRLALPPDDPGADQIEPLNHAVLLVPGSGVRAEMYYGQPFGISIAEHLLRAGYDVWVESWRASIDLPPTPYTWDHAALIDHPTALDTMLRVLDAEKVERRVSAIVHCQGSISFLMAAVAGRLSHRLEKIVSSAVSLFIEVGETTYAKQRAAIPVLSSLFPYVDAQWGIRPITPSAAAFAALARLSTPDCGNPTCRVANFMYGSGPDVLLRHGPTDNGIVWLTDPVHEWMGREVGPTPMSLIAQVGEASRRGHVVPAPTAPVGAPADYLSARPQTAAKFLFIAGDQNKMFDPVGQRRSADYIESTLGPGRASYQSLSGYGHLDTFWGAHAPTDVFPVITNWLR